MAGHSHAANVKHRKEAQGLKKAKLFTQLLRLIYVAVKQGGSNEDTNSSLRFALEKARQYSLPKDKIKNTIDRASGNSQDSESYEDVRYDGYGTGGVGIIVETLTDNRNRTASEVRSLFTKYGGNLGETGSLDFMFKRQGVIYYKKTLNFNALFEAAVENEAESVEEGQDFYIVLTTFESFNRIRTSLEKLFGLPEDANIEFNPTIENNPNPDQKKTVLTLVEALEDLDDVQNVWTNMQD